MAAVARRVCFFVARCCFDSGGQLLYSEHLSCSTLMVTEQFLFVGSHTTADDDAHLRVS